MQFNLSRVVGPAIGGLSIGVFGIAGSYYFNAISYLAVIIPLLFIRPQWRERSSKHQSMWRDLGAGLRYVRRQPILQVALLLQFMIAFLVFPYSTLLPIFARDIFHIGAIGLGVLNAAAGISALIGSVSLVLFSHRLEQRVRLLIILCSVGGFAALAFAFLHIMNAALLVLIVLGSCTVVSMTVTNTAVQTMTPEAMRGRVLSIWVAVAFGAAPFGNLVAGWVAQAIGAPLTLAIGGGLCAVVTMLVAVLQGHRLSHTSHAISYRQGFAKVAVWVSRVPCGDSLFFVVVRVDAVHTHHHKKSLEACSLHYFCFEDF